MVRAGLRQDGQGRIRAGLRYRKKAPRRGAMLGRTNGHPKKSHPKGVQCSVGRDNMNIGINGYRQQMALGGELRVSAGDNKALSAQDKMLLDAANVPGDTKRMMAYLLQTEQAKDVEDAIDKATDPNFKPKSFADILNGKIGG